jgi:hypothetical protein
MTHYPTPKQLDVIRLLGSQYELVRTVLEYADGHISTHIGLYLYANADHTQRLKIVDKQAVSERTFTCLLTGGWIEEREQHALGVKSRKPVERAFEAYYRLTDRGRAAIHAA